MDIDLDLNATRISFTDNRNKNGVRMDRNEKVIDWDKNIFLNIFNDIETRQFTCYPPDNFNLTYLNIAKYLNININNICLNNGADGIIREIFVMFQQRVNTIGILDNTYSMYEVYANLFKKNIIKIPYIINLSDKIENICSLNKKIFYNSIDDIDMFCFVSPNQVSNNDFTLDEIDYLCYSYPNKIFIIDEVYFGFGHFSTISLINKYNNIFIIRSFSKTFGLASIRLGILIANEISVKPFILSSPIYSLNLYTANICNYFINNIEIVNKYNQEVIKGRDWFIERLKINNYNVIYPKSLSIIIVFQNKDEFEDSYNKCISNLFYIKKIKINNYDCLRITCAPKYMMVKLYNTCFKNNNINEDYCKYLYNTRGFFLINDVYNNKEIKSIIDEIKIINIDNNIEVEVNKNQLPFRLEYFTKNMNKINEIIYKDKYIKILKQCLNTTEITLFKDKFICKKSLSNETVEPHVDGNFYTYNYRLNKKTRGWYTYAPIFIQYGIFLTDNTENNGGIYFDNIRNYTLEDFHEKFIGNDSNDAFIKDSIIKEFNIDNNNCTLVDGNCGDIVIFNPNCIHFGYGNTTTELRLNLYLTFNKKEDGDFYWLAKKDKELLIDKIGLSELNKRMRS